MNPTEMQGFHNPLEPFRGPGVPGDAMEQVLSLQTLGGTEESFMAITDSCTTSSCSGDTRNCDTGTCSGSTSGCSTSTC